MSTVRIPLALLFVFALFTAGCEGPTGPRGPQGPQGPQGPSGPAGALVQSFEVTFDVDANTVSLSEDGLVLFQNYEFPEITESVERNGFVQAYYLASNDTWTAMPYTFGDESPEINAVDYTLTLGYAWNVGLVQVFYEASAPFAIDFARSRTLKIVVADARAAATAGVNWSDYSSVQQRFNLDE